MAPALQHLEDFAEEQLTLLKSVPDSWQPADFLPDLSDADWHEKAEALRINAQRLSDEVLVVLTGNTVTEEALPAYQSALNRVYEAETEKGAGQSPWALWVRGWTAEENRHGDLLNMYLYLSGRVDMRSVQKATHHLMRNGFDPNTDKDIYRSIVYVSFQERATKISHANTGRLAERCGDPLLARICAAIAGDEARHKEAYKRLFRKTIELDPSTAVIAFGEMMRRKISMPALLMACEEGDDLFARFAVVAQRSGMYTIRDYAEIIAHLVEYWKVGSLTGLSAEACAAQQYVCGLPERYLRNAERLEERISEMPREPFDWIYGRSV